MARALIVYGTTDGQTRKIADVLGETFRTEGWEATVLDAKGISPEVNPETYDRVIVAASIHIGNYQRAVKGWVRAHATELNRAHSAFLSVCLGVLESRHEARQAVRDIMERFLHHNGWQPSVSKTVPGAIRYSRYNWLKKLIMKRIAAKAGGDTDTTRDYEYTDWEDLRAFVHRFAHAPASIGRLIGTPPYRERASPIASSVE